jgi:hypothetical protein
MITISPISQISRLPYQNSKDHIVPSHVHNNNITIVYDTLLTFWVMVLSPIEWLFSYHQQHLTSFAFIGFGHHFFARVLLLINCTSIIMSSGDFQNSWLLDLTNSCQHDMNNFSNASIQGRCRVELNKLFTDSLVLEVAIQNRGGKSKSVHWELLHSTPRPPIPSMYLDAAVDLEVNMRSSTLLKYRTEYVLAIAMTCCPHLFPNLCVTFASMCLVQLISTCSGKTFLRASFRPLSQSETTMNGRCPFI